MSMRSFSTNRASKTPKKKDQKTTIGARFGDGDDSLLFQQSTTKLQNTLQAREDKTNAAVRIVKDDGKLLQFRDLDMRANKDVVLAAVHNDPSSFQYAEESLKNDRMFMLQLARETYKQTAPSLFLKYASRSASDDDIFVFCAWGRVVGRRE